MSRLAHLLRGHTITPHPDHITLKQCTCGVTWHYTRTRLLRNEWKQT